MSTFTPEELAEILGLHIKWLQGEPDGKRANLAGADLSGANLSGANLARANLARADLYSANLARADLSGANLARANLYRANLARADLSGANLARANLYRADLYSANLGDLHVLQIGPIGSRRDHLVVRWGKDPDGSAVDRVQCGCFTGTLAEFEAAVKATHGDNQHGRDYRAAIALARSMQTVEVPA